MGATITTVWHCFSAPVRTDDDNCLNKAIWTQCRVLSYIMSTHPHITQSGLMYWMHWGEGGRDWGKDGWNGRLEQMNEKNDRSEWLNDWMNERTDKRMVKSTSRNLSYEIWPTPITHKHNYSNHQWHTNMSTTCTKFIPSQPVRKLKPF